MGYIVIAPIGDNPKAFFVGMKQFATERAILITPPDKMEESRKLAKKLEDFTIDAEIKEIENNLMEDMFRIFGDICSIYDNEKIIVNLATGDQLSTCAALSASYANGIKAFGIMNKKCMLMPIMKLSYYNELSDKKMNILQSLDLEEFKSLKKLSEELSLSVSLTSYHINGNYKYKGLKDYRLIDVKEENNNLYVKLSEMGNLLLKGYINQRGDNK